VIRPILKKYSEKTQEFFPKPIVWLGWAFALISLSIAYFNYVIGLLFLLISLLVITGQEGLIVNFSTKKVKYYWGVFGLKFGTWESLPKFARITISPKVILEKGTKISSKKHFEVKIWFDEINDFVLAFTGNLGKCHQKASILSKNLKLKVLDMSKTNGKAKK